MTPMYDHQIEQVLKGAFTMEKENRKPTGEEAVKLTKETLDKVSGAGDPFADEPRVPENPIDDELRKDG